MKGKDSHMDFRNINSPESNTTYHILKSINIEYNINESEDKRL